MEAVVIDRNSRSIEKTRDAPWRPARTVGELETMALLLSAAVLVVGFVISLPLFWGSHLSISGSGSIGG